MDIEKANRILEKLGLSEIDSAEIERRTALYEQRDRLSINDRLIGVIERNFQEVSEELGSRLTSRELAMLKKIPSDIRNLI